MRKLWILAGLSVGFGVAVLAFVFLPGAGRSAAVNAQEDAGQGREMIIAVEDVEVVDGVETVVSGEVSVQFENPDVLPDGPAAVDGIFKGEDSGVVSVGTGNIEVSIEVEQVNDQEPVMAVSAAHSGPLVEVQTTTDTEIYLETTSEPQPTQADLDAGVMTMQRTLESGSLADLADDTMIQAWGSTGNDGVITADVLVITPIR